MSLKVKWAAITGKKNICITRTYHTWTKLVIWFICRFSFLNFELFEIRSWWRSHIIRNSYIQWWLLFSFYWMEYILNWTKNRFLFSFHFIHARHPNRFFFLILAPVWIRCKTTEDDVWQSVVLKVEVSANYLPKIL